MEERLQQMVSQSESYGDDVPGYRVYRRTRKGILQRLNTFEAYAPCVARPECVKELHAMCIAAKRLRQTLAAPRSATEVSAEMETAALAGDGASAATP
jgi:hypothetical protein